MRPLLSAFVIAVFLGALLGAGAGIVVFGADAGPSVDPPAPAETGATDGNLTELYEQTADSVAKLRVETDAGTSQGSGFLYDRRHVVTNAHVVQGATDLTVQFSDGAWRTGTVVGTDPYTDLAVVRVDSVPNGVEPLPLAESVPRPGQPVAAFGSPFGLQGTITHGIVSGVNRSMRVNGGFSVPDTVQTDAPVNPGNSGGPLVSMDGTVVGVNRAKEGDNIGFAISARLVERVVPELIADGSITHSFVGIRTVPVTPSVAAENDLERATGIAVVETTADGPADGVLQAGNWTGTSSGGVPSDADVIVAIDGQPVHSQEDLSRYLMLHTRPGETVSLTVYRGGQRLTVDVTLGERPSPT
ncbi:S1C family serine protease [Halodesulfurarchaeum formicicum]|uniref:S1C family serine protease n=1 Tax=Halodesulfurarchaeum formicicum TaxID=1873524 RepID=UPI0009F313A6|nr:trypsin-like peptidase domain-containing protein [Halodesulfurarchaeum formicicum]